MWPFFTVRVLQDNNFWQILTQILSSIAVIIAAGVAASFSGKKDRVALNAQKKYLLALFNALQSTLDITIEGIEEEQWERSVSYISELRTNCQKIIGIFDEDLHLYLSSIPYEAMVEMQYVIQFFHVAIGMLDELDQSNWDKAKATLISQLKSVKQRADIVVDVQKRFVKPFPMKNISLLIYRIKENKRVKQVEKKNNASHG